MKGLIFTEFLNFVEKAMSYDMVDNIIIKSGVASGGSYTSIGSYNSAEFFCLIKAFSEETGLPKNKLLVAYGEYLFGTFVSKFPVFFIEKKSVFEFLSIIETHIHVEVKKFYTDADLPHFQCQLKSPEKFIMIYQSSRPLADLAEGLIRGCIQFYQENIILSRKDLVVKNAYKSKFILIKSKFILIKSE